MRPADQTEYIVQCIREGGSMYEDDARKFLAEHDTHVRAEALNEADLLPKADVVAWLVKKAREGTPVELLASKADRGAIRPDNLRMLPAKFFEIGRTYTEPGDVTDWRFRCDAVTTHPATGERTALGWRHFRGEWSEYSYGEGDFEIHQIADEIGSTPQCPEALYSPETDVLRRCIHHGRHDWHEAEGGIQWRHPAEKQEVGSE